MSDATSKKHYRQMIRHQRRQLSTEKKIEAAQKIAQHVLSLSEFQQSQHIAYYLANDGEVDPHIIILHAEKNNKHAYLPVLDLKNHYHLEFYRYRCGDPIVNNHLGIGEPNTKIQPYIAPKDLELVFLPSVAFDKSGNRIGRGAGYYDRTFAFIHTINPKNKPCLIALAYDFQKIHIIEPDEWDIRLNIIVTEKKIYKI